MNSTDLSAAKIPVTIVTGFLGSGKTTLLNHILHQQHGHKIAVIENEFGAVGIDNEILLQDNDQQIVQMNNGCLCCTVRGDLIRILGKLSYERKTGVLDFERVIIETTGIASPGPVAQTFFVDYTISRDYLLDGMITVVDARHAPQQLTEHHEAQNQVGFADRILLSKTDLVSEQQLAELKSRLARMNPRAPQQTVQFGQVDIQHVLDIKAFDVDAILAIEPAFLDDAHHHHHHDVQSFVFRDTRPFDLYKLEIFLTLMTEIHGADMLRYKGVLYVSDDSRRLVFQGVHTVMGGDKGRPWGADETPESVLVIIGRNLPKAVFQEGLQLCLTGADIDGYVARRQGI